MRLLLLCFVALAPVYAQISGDIQVNVTDRTGAVVPNAKVTATSRATGAARTAATDNNGSARFTLLAIGDYDVKVEAAGFTAFSTQATVASGGVTTVPATLEVQTAVQQILVTESAVALDTVNAQLQTTTESREVVELPLSNTGVLGLAGTTPGVTPVTPRNPFLGLGSFNSNGGRGRANNITLDSATATDISTTGSAGLGTIPIEGIKEFNIITNNFNAEYGRNSSAQVQILTKSGGNDFHGSLFEYFRNDKLNARDYFDRTGSASILRDNDWGAAGGGRIIRDRLFWFGTYEQEKIRGAGSTRVATVPTPAQVAGPIDPTAKALLQRLMVPTDPSGTVSNPAPNTTDVYAFSGRGDVVIRQNDLFYVRFGMQDIKQERPSLTFISSNLPTNGANLVSRAYNATMSETHTFGARTVNQFLASFGRTSPIFEPLNSFGGPEIDFNDGTSTFGIWSGVPQGRKQNTFQYLDTLTHSQGPHQLKFGAEVGRIQAPSFFDSNVRGTLVFNTLSDFLAGRPVNYSQRFGNSVRGNRVWNDSFFAQDDWRVRRNLILNLGVRLEVAGGPSEVNNILSNLDLNNHNALGGAGTGPLGAFDVGGSYFHRNWNWGPRFGFAWNPSGGKLVVRGGYGIAYDFIYLNPITNGRFLPPFMFNLSVTDFSGGNSLANLIAGTSTFQQQGAALVGGFGTTIRNFGSFSPVDQNLRNPQTQQWNLTIEREGFLGMLFRASYVGTKSNYLQRSRVINPIAPGLVVPATSAADEDARIAQFRAIYNGSNPGPTTPSNRIDPRFNGVTLVDSSANSNYHGLQLYVARRFAHGYSFSASYTWSKTIDDISDALGVLANDLANQQDPFNNRNNRAVSQFDVPHRLVVTHVFEAGSNWTSNRLARAMLGGWQFSGIFQAQSGFPATILAGTRKGIADPLLIAGFTSNFPQRADLVGSTVNVKFDANPGLGGLNPNKATGSGVAQPLIGHLGTLGRNTVRLNPLLNTDWTVGRRFKITERFSTELQAQVFNVFNNTTFSRPGLTLSAPSTFGYYTDTDTDSRRVTLLMRLVW